MVYIPHLMCVSVIVMVLSAVCPLVSHAQQRQLTTEITGMNLQANTDVTITGTATLVSGASGVRNILSCSNTSASVAVRWGDSTVSATKGQRFPANTSIEIKTRGAVYMISEGANVTVSCTEEIQ